MDESDIPKKNILSDRNDDNVCCNIGPTSTGILINPSSDSSDKDSGIVTIVSDQMQNCELVTEDSTEISVQIQSDDDFDSDDSLGILPLDSLEEKSDLLEDRHFIIDMPSFPLPKISEREYINIENAQNVNPALSSTGDGIPLRREIIPSFEKNDLNITKNLSFSKNETNVSKSFTSLEKQDDFNSTFTHHLNRTFQIQQLPESENIDLSPLGIPEKFTDSESEEVSLHHNIDSPKYCSTPNHETNLSFILDEDFFSSSVPDLKKTIVKEDIKKNTFLKNDELDIENHPHEFNKTYHNIYHDADYLQVTDDAASLNTNVSKSDELNKTYELEASLKPLPANGSRYESLRRHLLNTTISLPKDLRETVTMQIEKLLSPPYPPPSGSQGKKFVNEAKISENADDSSVVFGSKNPDIDKKKTRKSITIQMSQDKNHVNEAKISESVASGSKYPAIDKKKTRKSSFVPCRSENIDALDKQISNRRKTLGSVSSQSGNIFSNQMPSSVQRQHSSDLKSFRSQISLVQKNAMKGNVSSSSKNISAQIVKKDGKLPSDFKSKIPYLVSSPKPLHPKPSVNRRSLLPVLKRASTAATASAEEQKKPLKWPPPKNVLSLKNEFVSSIGSKRQHSSKKVDPALFGAPPSPASVLEALYQRLEKCKRSKESAQAEGNNNKVRQLDRIIKSGEKAIENHKAGLPVIYEEFSAPQGFSSIPVAERKTKPKSSAISYIIPSVASKNPAPDVPFKKATLELPPKKAVPEVPQKPAQPQESKEFDWAKTGARPKTPYTFR